MKAPQVPAVANFQVLSNWDENHGPNVLHNVLHQQQNNSTSSF